MSNPSDITSADNVKSGDRFGALVLVNGITILGLLTGLAAAIIILRTKDYTLFYSLITVCLILDGIDGFLARRLSVVTKFGAYADSLSDFVAFGICPVAAIFSRFEFNAPSIIISLMWLFCSFLRLTFYLRTNDQLKPGFIGLPLAVAGFGLIGLIDFTQVGESSLYAFSAELVLLFLMTSRLRFYRNVEIISLCFFLTILLFILVLKSLHISSFILIFSLIYIVASLLDSENICICLAKVRPVSAMK